MPITIPPGLFDSIDHERSPENSVKAVVLILSAETLALKMR